MSEITKMFRLIAALSVLCLVWASSEASNITERVVGGRGANINEFPFQISLQDKGEHFCGGSILNEQWMLTAAHCTVPCLQRNCIPNLTIRVGSSNWSSGGTVKSVEKIIVHPKYNAANMDYDISLLRLQGRLAYSASIKPVKILRSPILSGTPVCVSGWGQIHNNVPTLPKMLNQLTMQFMPKAECSKWHPRNPLTDRMICAFGIGQDSCMGDSGGPLCLEGTYTQVGLVSWGIACGLAGLPGAYTDLTNPEVVSFMEQYVGKMI